MTATLTRLRARPAIAFVRGLARDSSSLLFVAQIVAAGAAFLANILAARAMDPSGRGELALLLQIAYFGSLGILLGSDRSVVAIYSGRPARTVTAAFLRLLVRPSLVALVGAAVILALPVPGLESWRVRLVLAALFMVTNAANRATRSIAIASDRSRQYAWYCVACAVLLVGGLTGLTVLGIASSAMWMLAYFVTETVTTGLWLWWWARRPTRTGTTQQDTDEADHTDDLDDRVRARREGLQLLPATLAHSGTLRVDRLLLAALASTSALGLYATVATMTELIAWPLLAYADSRLGIWRQAFDRGELRLRRVLLGAVAYAAVAAAIATVALQIVLVPLFGERYASATVLILPLTIAAAVFGLSQLLVNALTSVRRGLWSSAVEVVGVVTSVVAYVVLIEHLGALGAALGSLIGYSTCLVVAAVVLVRVHR